MASRSCDRCIDQKVGDGSGTNDMKVMIITDAWKPQVNGVVTTLGKIGEGLSNIGHEVRFVTPLDFRSVACPTYPEIRLSLFASAGITKTIKEFAPDAIHIATEGPLGIAARRYCLAHRLAFTTAFHTRFAEYVHARFRIPVDFTYRWLRRFHAPSRAVMVPTPAVCRELESRHFNNTVLWTRGVDTETFYPVERSRLGNERPIFLYVGRVAVERPPRRVEFKVTAFHRPHVLSAGAPQVSRARYASAPAGL